MWTRLDRFLMVALVSLVFMRTYFTKTALAEFPLENKAVSPCGPGNEPKQTQEHQNESFKAFQDSFSSHKHEWCPQNSQCNSTEICQPCKKQFLVIIATGRSGSTTLMEMLGSLPNIRMAGENDNFLHRIYKLHENIHPSFKINKEQHGAWKHHAIPEQGMACAEQNIIESINPPTLTKDGHIYDPQPENSVIIGFKTIRFSYYLNQTTLPEEEFSNFVSWFVEHFPCTRVVVNIRSDIETQATSQVKNLRRRNVTLEEAKLDLKKLNDRHKDLVSNKLKGRAYFLDSVRWTKDITKFHGLIDWLGFSKECYFKHLLDFNNGASGYGQKVYKHDPKCQYLGKHASMTGLMD